MSGTTRARITRRTAAVTTAAPASLRAVAVPAAAHVEVEAETPAHSTGHSGQNFLNSLPSPARRAKAGGRMRTGSNSRRTGTGSSRRSTL
ncbi:hypothetical protein ABZW18_15060 [Streptomyces sp. NPDC004647]|uniref:hypothetical protein n=1 Tax=Streptomyces sp. NPDC004647 TaxID=3154671 RepID=UPI0033A8F955